MLQVINITTEVVTIEALAIQETALDIKDVFNYYHEMVYIAKRIVYDYQKAEDVVQDALIKAMRSYQHLKEPDKLKAWFRTIVIRTAIDLKRREKKKEMVSFDALLEQGIEHYYCDDSVEQSVNFHYTCREVQSLMDQLSPKLRQVISLKYVEDYSDQQIADALGISLSAAKTRIHRARKQLLDLRETE
ncbi:RNA polymerase sigma factor [Halolactibacillus alkaliphilus]|uniref:RNA polymerase sigma factor n=1 Tax=Halolactibacillus alkaliphilus TaxID=442899 RepID=A0A511X3Y6_9BACI|nr:RNA polymerase sigma factor [Halolactibacillus alkaliphilus]GEN57651.1 RNA polymerase sigma factor [Halolactibacillus alkaliphilus]GGN74527.1 RNA polymerase sigma factor [Halolactibacillus alkaliphilus]SFP02156.1 RNA polymerase sigma-70 factor, ECF subfamily [Halolactibacillus alkaliphilus]